MSRHVSADTTEDDTDGAELHLDLVKALVTLPVRQRQGIVLRDFVGLRGDC